MECPALTKRPLCSTGMWWKRIRAATRRRAFTPPMTRVVLPTAHLLVDLRTAPGPAELRLPTITWPTPSRRFPYPPISPYLARSIAPKRTARRRLLRSQQARPYPVRERDLPHPPAASIRHGFGRRAGQG